MELTAEEIYWALTDVRNKKAAKLQYEKNEVIRQEKAKEIMEAFTPDQLGEYCMKFYFERFQKVFILDEQNSKLSKKLAQYFSNSQDFEVGGYSLSKGIFLMGNVGTGKTELMKFFQKNKKRCYKIVSCKEIAEEYSFYKEEITTVYSTPIEKPIYDHTVFFQKYIGYCFDDLGTEEIKNNYGNKKNVMADILQTIYDKKDFTMFHLTSNIPTKQKLEEIYGSRVVSRLREMFNVFVLEGEDRRK